MSVKESRDFERPIEELEKRIEELRQSPDGGHEKEIAQLERRARRLIEDVYTNLTPWQVTLVARHPKRPYTLDYIGAVFEEFVELHGDRLYGDDPAIVGGLARLNGRPVMVVGQQKGRTTKERVARNYGMPHPEGYRKALRLFELAERFKRPVITFIDTPGAAPDIEAEERGQAEAIARNLIVMAQLKTPIVSVVIGEGGSGGALAVGVADRVMMLKYATYSVISPEGCAAILWKDGAKADLAARALKMRAEELLSLKVIDRVIDEPIGGAHRGFKITAENVKGALTEAVNELAATAVEKLVAERHEKYRRLGVFEGS